MCEVVDIRLYIEFLVIDLEWSNVVKDYSLPGICDIYWGCLVVEEWVFLIRPCFLLESPFIGSSWLFCSCWCSKSLINLDGSFVWVRMRLERLSGWFGCASSPFLIFALSSVLSGNCVVVGVMMEMFWCWSDKGKNGISDWHSFVVSSGSLGRPSAFVCDLPGL